MVARDALKQNQDLSTLELLERLLKAGQELIAVQDLGVLLRKTAETAGSVLGADVIVLYEYREEDNDLAVPPVIWGDIWHPEALSARNQRQPDNESAVFRMIERPKPRYAPDAIEGWTQWNENWHQENSFVYREKIVSSAAVPLMTGGKRLGLLFANYRSYHAFPPEEQKIIEIFATQAATAIANAKLSEQLKERKKRINSIHGIGLSTTSGTGYTEILDNILLKTVHLMKDASVGEIWLLDEQGGKLEVRAAYGNIETEVRELDLGEGIVGWVAKSKKPHCVENVEDDLHFKRRLAGTRSELAVPLLKGNQLIGVVNIEHPQPGAFVEEDTTLLQAIASQVVVAIENARLFEELRERATQLERLQQVTTTIAAQPTDLEGTLRLVTSQLIDIFEGASCAIRLYDPVAREFGTRIASGALEERVKHPPRTIGASQHIVHAKEPVYATDTSHTLPNGQPVIRQETAREGVQAVAYLPLLSERDVIGILYVEWTTPRRFPENDKRILELFADQATICLRNARIYHDLERRVKALQVLTEIGRTIGTLGIDQILDLIYDKISGIIDLSDALFYIAFYDMQRDRVSFGLVIEQDDGNKIDEIRWGKRNSKEIPEWKPRARRDPPGLTEYVIHNEQPVLIIEDFERQARDLGIQVWPEIGRRKRPTRSWLGVPMKVRGKVVGVINIQSLERERAFDEDHLNLLDTVADQAATAIENARLYADLAEAQERRIEAERFAYLGQAADGIAHRINNTVALIPLCVSDIKEHLGTLDKYVEDNLDMVARNAQYILDLAVQLQRPSRRSEVGQFDVNLLIEEAVDVAGIPADIELVSQLDKTLPKVQSKKLLIDVFVELITNAVKAMDRRSTRMLEIGSGLADEGYVEVWFKDTGKGISEDELEQLFKLFYTTAEKREPTAGVAKGFGLWWVKTFLAWQGGEISVESQVDIGTTFVIKLPAGAH